MRRHTEVEGTRTSTFAPLSLLASTEYPAIVKHTEKAGTGLVALSKNSNGLGKHHHANVQRNFQGSFVHGKAKQFHISKVWQGKCLLLLFNMVTRNGSLLYGNRALQWQLQFKAGGKPFQAFSNTMGSRRTPCSATSQE
jgi:hypothetical protein